MRGSAVLVSLVALAACTASDPVPPDRPGPPTGTIRAFVGDGAPLEPGRYTYDRFEPSMTFEVGPGWIGGHVLPEFYDVQREEGALVGFARPTFVMAADGEVDVDGIDAREALEAIVSLDALEAGPVGRTEIGGHDTVQVRTSSETGVELFGGDDGSFTVEAGRHRIMAIDVDGALVLVIEHIWAEPRAPIEPLTQAVIDSVRFDGDG
jgi:hypothetical protein